MIGDLIGYQPADVFNALGPEGPRSALFTTFTFSAGVFQHQYLLPLLQHGCGNITVLADKTGYDQSLFGAAAVQGIGTDYRLRRVAVLGAFHGKLVLVRTRHSMIVGVGSGNLTASGLQTNAEVGALYIVDDPKQLEHLDALVIRLRAKASLENAHATTVEPIVLTSDSRLLTSLDNSILDQMELPEDVRRIEIVSPFVDDELKALAEIRDLWPNAKLRLRLDPGFGSLSDALLATSGEHVEILVPIENDDVGERRSPAVHGKLICLVGDHSATAILGSANLSRPAFLSTNNFEAVIERRLPVDAVDKLLRVPRVQWRVAKTSDRRKLVRESSPSSVRPLIATLTFRDLRLAWPARGSTNGSVSLWCRGRCVVVQPLGATATEDTSRCAVVEISDEAKNAIAGSCFAEVRLDDDSVCRGWVEIADRLDIAPETKRQLALLEEISSDPLDCNEDDVVKFIELLQRKLSFVSRHQWYPAVRHKHEGAEEYDETPIQRSQLLETSRGFWRDQPNLVNRLVNRSLDAAIRDLRFFNRAEAKTNRTRRTHEPSADHVGEQRPSASETSLPPKIVEVLRRLFGQLAEAFDSAKSDREVVQLVAQIPTCLKALSYAVERWLPRTRDMDAADLYFRRAAVACLAPGFMSSLHSKGAILRVPQSDWERLKIGPDFTTGVAILESYVLLATVVGSPIRRNILKDMHDVVRTLPMATDDEVRAIGSELWRLQNRTADEQPDLIQLRAAMSDVPGELATLRSCRKALFELIRVVTQRANAKEQIKELANLASGGDPSKSENLMSLLLGGAGSRRLIEIEGNEHACPECCTTFPIATQSRLNDSTVVHKCSCGCFLVRSLET